MTPHSKPGAEAAVESYLPEREERVSKEARSEPLQELPQKEENHGFKTHPPNLLPGHSIKVQKGLVLYTS